MMKKIISGIALLSMLFPSTLLQVVKAASPVIQTTISVKKTGSEPFDANTWDGVDLAKAGYDQSENNNVVRLQDSITYQVEVSVNDANINNLVATVILDKKQAWIEIPTGCKTDANEVTPVSSISTDKRILICNTGMAIEGTNKIIFPTARAIGVSNDGTEITLNNDTVGASVSAQGDGSNIASDTSEDTIVTANFRVDTTKDYKVPDKDIDGDGQLDRIYNALKKTGPGGEDGYVIEFIIKSTYQNGSMIADAPDEANGNFEMDYNLLDYYTDDNDNNNNSGIGGNLSTAGVLYTWDTDMPACELLGDHGVNASVSCTAGTGVIDYIGPGSSLDGIADPSVNISLTDIDVRDPDSDGNLIELQVNLWFRTTENISNHQSCAGGVCQNFVTNQIATSTGGIISGFNPVSTEDASNNNLLNYNGTGEPVFTNQTSSYPLMVTSNGIYSYGISYYSEGTWKTPEQRVSLGQEVPFGMYHYFSYGRIKNGQRSQVCAKLDTTQVEYVGIAPTPDNNMAWIWRKNNPNHYSAGPGIASKEFPALPETISYLYTNEPNVTLTEQRDDVCNDDVNGDGNTVIMKLDGSLVDENGTSTTGIVDWYEDSTMVPNAEDGTSGVTKIRQEWIVDADYRLEKAPGGTTFYTTTQFLTKVRTDATGYGSNKYIPLFMSARLDNSGAWAAWSNTSTVEVNDFEEAGFSFHYNHADRNILVPSGHSIKKYTDPKGIKVVRGGDIVDFIVEPKIFGMWDPAITTSNVYDSLPAGTSYILGSERFSVDGGTTWLTRADYIATNPGISFTYGENLSPSIIRWYFGDVNSGDQLPLIKYSVQIDPNLVSGTFTNTATIIGNIGADNNGDGSGDNKSASYQLTILPEYGFDVFKKNQQDIYSVNTPFTFELLYKNLGGEDYSKGDFIDILPFNGDSSGTISGLSSERTPPSNFDGFYRVTKLEGTNNEVFYATNANPTTIQNDPCHEDNQAAGYTPVVGDVCFTSYVNNGNKWSGGSTVGTGNTPWVQCSGVNPVVCGGIDSKDITGIRFTVNSVSSSGGKTAKIELTPEGNIGGTPDIDSNSNVTSASTGNIYTNTFSGRVPEISLLVISNDTSVTMVSGSIGDKIFLDNDNSGTQNAGDTAIDNVTVSLLDKAGNPVYKDPATGAIVKSSYPGAVVYTTTTDINGNYLFENLPSETFTVVVDETTLPNNLGQTFDPDSTKDSKSTHILTDVTDVFGNVLDVEDNTAQDFGYTTLSSISDKVWIDANADGIQNNGELGLSGVTLNLLDAGGSIIATTTTGANGNYVFDSLFPGDYKVEIVLPTDYIRSPNAQGSDTTKDSDILSNLKTNTISLGVDDHRTDVDMGVYKQAHIGDTVWFDTNKDGIQDAGEIGVAGVTVNLLDENGNQIATTTTAGDGSYNFDVDPGTYRVEFIKPAGYVGSPQYTGGNSNDSNANINTGKTAQITVISGQTVDTIDAGIYVPTGSVGDKVWIDANADGIQDAGEIGQAGITVELLNTSGVVIATAVTDSNGNYLFENVVAGDYKIKFSNLPVNYVFTPKNIGVDTADSNADTNSGETDTFTVNDQDSILSIDAGIYTAASIGNRVWFDSDEDGEQDTGEIGLIGVDVNLLDDSGNQVATTTTNANGDYIFSNLTPGKYEVEFVTPTNLVFSPKENTVDTTKDSNADISTGKTGLLTLNSGENITDIDAGVFLPLSSISDRVWLDTNADGIQDSGEISMSGVTLKLLNSSGTVIATTVTDTNGNYLFDDLQPGDYKVEIAVPAEYILSENSQGTDVTLNSDFLTNFKTNTISLGVDDHRTDIDAGLYKLAHIGDKIWNDSNADGKQDSGENSIAGITVNLLDLQGNIVATTQTDSNGLYGFDIKPGKYSLEFIKTSNYSFSPKNTTTSDLDSDVDVLTGKTAIVTLNSADDIRSVDVGMYEQAHIGDRVWFDTNKDGKQDSGEVGIGGVVVHLFDSSGNIVAITTTAGDGTYTFDVTPGTYSLAFIKPVGYVGSPQNVGGSSTDSNADIITGRTASILVSGGENNTSIDAGMYVPTGSIGDKVWFDINANGIQDAGEFGKSGITVKLLNSSGSVVTTAITDTSGNYLFEDVVAGDYSIEFSGLSSNSRFSPKNIGTNDSDSNVDRISGKTDVFTLNDKDSILTIDAGIYELGSIRGTAMHDLNRGGTQDLGDSVLEGITVNLLDDSGNIVATTITDSNGNYLFDNLEAGEYRISFVRPSEFNSNSEKNIGPDTSKDFDIDSQGSTSTISLLPGDNIENIDAGFYKRGGGRTSSIRSTSRAPVTVTPVNPPREQIQQQEVSTVQENNQTEETPDKEQVSETEEELDISLLKKDYVSYKIQRKKLDKIIEYENKQGLGLTAFPRLLPQTGTPISQRIKTRKNPKVETSLPDKKIFRLAGSKNSDLNFWKTVLPEQDRNGDEYIVIPSNGLVVPINNVPKDTADFSKMISGKEIKVNDYLKTGVMSYPGSSKNDFGELGNKVIFGHSSYWKKDNGRYKTHFQKIIEMDTGEEVWVYKKINGVFKRFRYRVEKSYNTPSSDTSVLKPGVGSNLTLFTCTPIGGIKGRWIIKAKYINEDKIQLQKEIEGLDIATKYKLSINKFVYKLSKYSGKQKKRIILKIYTRITKLEERQTNKQILDILKYLKIRLLIELFER